jgi:hypothetical protein
MFLISQFSFNNFLPKPQFVEFSSYLIMLFSFLIQLNHFISVIVIENTLFLNKLVNITHSNQIYNVCNTGLGKCVYEENFRKKSLN